MRSAEGRALGNEASWRWAQVPAAPSPRRGPPRVARWLGPAIAAVASVAALHRGSAVAALVLAALAATTLASRRAFEAVAHLGARLGRALGTLASTVGTGLVEAVVSLPGRALRRVLGGRGEPAGSAWRPRAAMAPTTSAPDRPYAADAPGYRPRPARPLPRLTRLASIAIVVLVVDAVAGALAPLPAAEPWAQPVQRTLGDPEPGLPGATAGDATRRAAAAGPAAEAWTASCLADYDRIAYDYVPFLLRRMQDQDGGCIELTDGARVGPAAPRGAATVWLVGGSEVLGPGQRADRTLAAQLQQRLSTPERPVAVVNLGLPGATAHQEALLIEQQLAVRPEPAAIVVHHGANDLAVRSARPTERLDAFEGQLWRSDEPEGRRSLARRWADGSFAVRAARWFADGVAEGAPADETGSTTEVEAVLTALARGRTLRSAVLAGLDVPVLEVLQPMRSADVAGWLDQVAAGLPSDVVDLSDALDDAAAPVFLDGVHLNEAGATAVAERLTTEIERRDLLDGRG